MHVNNIGVCANICAHLVENAKCNNWKMLRNTKTPIKVVCSSITSRPKLK